MFWVVALSMAWPTVMPMTDMAVTRVRPMVSEAAVTAVRRGLRTAFSAASLPEMPKTFSSSGRTRAMTGRDSIGSSTNRPMSRKNAPCGDGRAALALLAHAEDDHTGAEDGQDAADGVAQHQGLHGRREVGAAHGGDRGDLGRPAGGQPGGEHGDHDADDQGGQDGRRGDDQRTGRDLRLEELHRGAHGHGEADAAGQADDRGDGADDGGLGEDRALDLAAVGADGAQQGQFPGALGDQHREGVVDEEDADEEGDTGEDQQALAHAGHGPLDELGLLGGEGGAGLGFGALAEQGLDPGQQLVGGGAVLGRYGDLLVEAGLEVQLLGDPGVEQDQAAARVDGAVLGGEDAGEGELLDRAVGGDADLVADLVLAAGRALLVEGDLVVLGRAGAAW